MTRTAWPCDCTYALVVGVGPTKLMSMDPERIAVTASPPALNVWGSMVTFEPSSCAKKPFFRPTSAGACVRLGKYPSLIVSGASSDAFAVAVPHAQVARSNARATTAGLADIRGTLADYV